MKATVTALFTDAVRVEIVEISRGTKATRPSVKVRTQVANDPPTTRWLNVDDNIVFSVKGDFSLS